MPAEGQRTRTVGAAAPPPGSASGHQGERTRPLAAPANHGRQRERCIGARLGPSLPGAAPRACRQCGRSLPTPVRPSGRRRRFCSTRCRGRAMLRRQAGLPESLPVLGPWGRAPLARIVELRGGRQ
jgi:hypothetical protein